jgi:hypothetical protein
MIVHQCTNSGGSSTNTGVNACRVTGSPHWPSSPTPSRDICRTGTIDTDRSDRLISWRCNEDICASCTGVPKGQSSLSAGRPIIVDETEHPDRLNHESVGRHGAVEQRCRCIGGHNHTPVHGHPRNCGRGRHGVGRAIRRASCGCIGNLSQSARRCEPAYASGASAASGGAARESAPGPPDGRDGGV